ncbi:VC0807 family protein [Gilvimarinus sp. SDUM040013]|uniref:VC0807 family protein n=1 Tax=Gilvimarinus gilvus TaxID=3058038 RepID=A0ABU4RZU3_9GAMM|nr:VC0807 family protein [Gilvimarinus sp. SDUM040013]MDO3386420.1 VC0807 family protein [Gilvimarinus sp. SDUM040013]MDX6849686.1 VC0807 family protein [Gilvimarinus sp. SDUM040013]
MTDSATDKQSKVASTGAIDEPTATTTKEKPQKESLFLNILLNIVIPTLILTKLSGDEYLGTRNALVVALAFPLIYGIKDFISRREFNAFSILGTISILLTGGISLMELDPQYIAIKEAAIPGIIGLATLVSMKTRYPLVRTFLYNDKVLKTDLIGERLAQRGNGQAFDRALNMASYLVACSFFLSSFLNYVLAKWLLQSPPGTAEFNAELGKMTALSFPVIALPATIIMVIALLYLFQRIRKLTELDFEDVINAH